MIKKLKLPPKNSPIGTLMSMLTLMLAIASCSDKQTVATPAAAPVPKQAKAAVGNASQKPVQSQLSSSLRLPPPAVTQFDFSNKKDPFKPFIVKLESKDAKGAKGALPGALPIHSFDVGQFKLIGVITGGSENKAMVTDPGGKGYVLKAGMLIGKNSGRIASINSSGVTVIEQFKDDNGRVRKETIKLSLPKKQ